MVLKLLINGFLMLGINYVYALKNLLPEHRGAINNLCQNLALECRDGDESSCAAYKYTGCVCIESQGTCTRGNYSN